MRLSRQTFAPWIGICDFVISLFSEESYSEPSNHESSSSERRTTSHELQPHRQSIIPNPHLTSSPKNIKYDRSKRSAHRRYVIKEKTRKSSLFVRSPKPPTGCKQSRAIFLIQLGPIRRRGGGASSEQESFEFVFFFVFPQLQSALQ
jgi:hypothetical protein